MINYPVTVKKIGTKRFEVELTQQEDGQYVVKSRVKGQECDNRSEEINDFKTASHLFDLRFADLEGN